MVVRWELFDRRAATQHAGAEEWIAELVADLNPPAFAEDG